MYVHVEHYVLSGFQLLFHLRFQGAVEAVFVDFLIFQEFTVGDALAELFGREEEIFHPVTLRPPWRTAGCTDAESQIQVLSHQIIDERAFPAAAGSGKDNQFACHYRRCGYITLSTCSLICSSSSFIFTTMFCISARLLLLPVVLISRPISWAMKPNFLPCP